MNEEKEIGWHELAEGDQLKSVKNGRFYLIRGITSPIFGKFLITLDAPGTPTITRPSKAEPRAIVIRGETGKVIDTFISVFQSGEAE